ncbi:MAG: response regulator [Deltaproteobacteria bacterium]|nr:response regulator [Deltaproteobacteria bacterium]
MADALSAEGYPPTEFTDRGAFLDATFQSPPWAAVLWCCEGGAPDVGELCEVLRHHLGPQDSVVVLAGDAPPLGGEGRSASQALIPRPVDPARLLTLLAEREVGRAEAGSQIPRILVVDDDQNIVLLGSHIISGMGMIPLVAFDGPEAVDKTKTLHPDLLLLDINMPGMDGFDVIRALKADPAVNLIPIIVFSARRRDEDKVRALELGADDYVTKPFSLSELSARIDRLLKRTRTGMSASSTTGLPGSVSVEQVLSERVRRRAPLAVLYLDVDHFKAFNDCYGFSRGDSLIRQVADLVLGTVGDVGNPDDLVGHIGGDDFVVVTTPDRAVDVADRIIAGFDRIMPLYYDAADRSRGYLVTEGRRGVRTEFPVVTLSIAIVTNETREFHHAAEISDVAAQLKRYAKAKPGSLWVKDQRTNAVQKE